MLRPIARSAEWSSPKSTPWLLRKRRRPFSQTPGRASTAEDEHLPASVPSIAPKATLDIRSIIKSPGLYEQNCLDRNYKQQSRYSWRILELTQNLSALRKSVNDRRAENNVVKKKIAELQHSSRQKPPSDHENDSQDRQSLESLLAQAKGFKDEISTVAAQEKQMELEIQQLALALPNLSSHHTPNGSDAEVLEIVEPEDTRLQYHSGSPQQCLNRSSVSHVEIGAQLDIIDFAGAARTSGWGWYNLKNEGAMLEQALVQYSLSLLRRRGFTVVSPPSLVYSHIAAACGFQPRDQHNEQQIYTIQQPPKDKNKPPLSLAATAEIPLAGMYAEHVFSESDLPLRTAAVSRCFRAEAGARGVDTKGLYRVHEFTKVEMFAWSAPPTTAEVDDGYFAAEPSSNDQQDIFDEMVSIQKGILSSLGLTFRVLEMPSTDLGSPASRKIDMEVMFPSRRAGSTGASDSGWGEVTSTSACTDYQSRRLDVRVQMGKSAGAGGGGRLLTWPFTFNGTALAVPRVLAAFLETHYNESTETIAIPPVLRRWMDDMEVIKR